MWIYICLKKKSMLMCAHTWACTHASTRTCTMFLGKTSTCSWTEPVLKFDTKHKLKWYLLFKESFTGTQLVVKEKNTEKLCDTQPSVHRCIHQDGGGGCPQYPEKANLSYQVTRNHLVCQCYGLNLRYCVERPECYKWATWTAK